MEYNDYVYSSQKHMVISYSHSQKASSTLITNSKLESKSYLSNRATRSAPTNTMDSIYTNYSTNAAFSLPLNPTFKIEKN